MGFMGDLAGGGNAAEGGECRVGVVLCQAPEEDPDLRRHQGALADALGKAKVGFIMVGSVYDGCESDPDIALLRRFRGDLVLMGWHYPRALKWTLARQDIEINEDNRRLHLLDVREMPVDAVVKQVLAWTEEVATRAGDEGSGWVAPPVPSPAEAPEGRASRWYPVVDYDLCTNCMDCLDFCLFGVFGVDHEETLRVVQPDECRSDCPACSRVCPVGAIIFPKYRTSPSIAGGEEDEGGPTSLKLDLSKVFGKPKARHLAAMERDRELTRTGRKPAGTEKMDRLADDFDQVEI